MKLLHKLSNKPFKIILSENEGPLTPNQKPEVFITREQGPTLADYFAGAELVDHHSHDKHAQ